MGDFISGLDLEKEIRTSCLASVLIEQINKKLFGEVMTLIDASIRDVDSKKAIKSLISQALLVKLYRE